MIGQHFLTSHQARTETACHHQGTEWFIVVMQSTREKKEGESGTWNVEYHVFGSGSFFKGNDQSLKGS